MKLTVAQLYAIDFTERLKTEGVSVAEMDKVAKAKRKLILPLLTPKEIKYARARQLLDAASQVAKNPKHQVELLRAYLKRFAEKEKLFRPAVIVSTAGMRQRAKDHWKKGDRVFAYIRKGSGIPGLDKEDEAVIRDGPCGKHHHSIVDRSAVKFL